MNRDDSFDKIPNYVTGDGQYRVDVVINSLLMVKNVGILHFESINIV